MPHTQLSIFEHRVLAHTLTAATVFVFVSKAGAGGYVSYTYGLGSLLEELEFANSLSCEELPTVSEVRPTSMAVKASIITFSGARLARGVAEGPDRKFPHRGRAPSICPDFHLGTT